MSLHVDVHPCYSSFVCVPFCTAIPTSLLGYHLFNYIIIRVYIHYAILIRSNYYSACINFTDAFIIAILVTVNFKLDVA